MHWDVKLVQEQKPTEEKTKLLRKLTVSYLKTVRSRNPDAFIELVKIIREAAE